MPAIVSAKTILMSDLQAAYVCRQSFVYAGITVGLLRRDLGLR